MNAVIVLAAGESRRMGRQKALLPFGGTTLIRHIVDRIDASIAEVILVVTGHNPEPIEAELSDTRARCVHNDQYKLGMLSSVRCGLLALPHGVTRIAVVLGDQPSVSADLLDALFRALDESHSIAVPVFSGRRGHPIVFDACHRDELIREHDDAGLRGLTSRHSARIATVPWHEAGILDDLDTPEEYARVVARSEDAE